jgi:hypothetical protein
VRRLSTDSGYWQIDQPEFELETPSGIWIPVVLAAATFVALFGLIGVEGGLGGPAAFLGFGGAPSSDRSDGARESSSLEDDEARSPGARTTGGSRGRRVGADVRGRAAAAKSKRSRGRAWVSLHGMGPAAAWASAGQDDDDAIEDDDEWFTDDDDAESRLDLDDDDSAADDDDSADGDDDDSALGDDDDSALGDDDDSAEGDDDDSAEVPWDDFLDRTYCLDWAQADIVQPPGIDQLLDMTGAQLRDYSILAMPTDVDFETGEIFFLGAPGQRGNCSQDLRFATTDMPDRTGVSVYAEPDFEVVTSFFRLPVTVPPLTIYQLRLTGWFSDDATTIRDSTFRGRLDITAWADLACNLEGWLCYPCGAGLRRTCVDLSVENAVWIDSGSPTGIIRVNGG